MWVSLLSLLLGLLWHPIVHCQIESLKIEFEGRQPMLISSGHTVEYEVHKYCIQFNCSESTFLFILQYVRDAVIVSQMDDRVNLGYPLDYKHRNHRNEHIVTGAFINHPACVQYNIPTVPCSELQLLGDAEGGYAICNDFVTAESSCDLIYSFGVFKDISFEIEIGSTYDCKDVFAFDPSSTSVQFMAEQQELGLLPSFLHFLPYGISHHNQVSGAIETGKGAQEGMTLYDLPTLLTLLQHSNRTLFLLKMDIEGEEVLVLHSLVTDAPHLFFHISHLCMEVHW